MVCLVPKGPILASGSHFGTFDLFRQKLTVLRDGLEATIGRGDEE